MSPHPMIVVIRFVRLILAWVNTIFWSTTCIVIRLLGAPRPAWWLCPKPWGKISLGILGVRYNVVGEENLKPGALFAQNHDSFIDVVTAPTILPLGTKFVAKKELNKVPFWGWACQAGFVSVDRAKTTEAVKSLAKGIDHLPDGWSILIFPEGTRSKDGRLGKFKKGVVHMALQSDLPLVPVGTYGAAGIVPPRAWLIRSGPIEVTVGEPIDTSSWSVDTVDEHLAEVRKHIVALQAESRKRYEEKYGELVLEGADSALLELRGAR